VYTNIWRKVSKDPRAAGLVDDAKDGLEKVLSDRSYAFLVEKSYYDTIKSKNVSFANKSCEFARAEENFFAAMYAFPFQKGSPYVMQFSVGFVFLGKLIYYCIIMCCLKYV